MQPFIVFGASNAAGWSEIHLVDYHPSNLLRLLYTHEYLKISPDLVTLDFSNSPELEEGFPVLNEGFPGDTVYDLANRFEEDVINHNPSSVFLWPGLNDITMAVSVAFGRLKPGLEEEPSIFNYAEVLADYSSIEEKISCAADAINDVLGKMILKLYEKKVQVYLGTIPPFSSALANHSNETAALFKKDGLTLLTLVNDKIRKSPHVVVIDAYKALLDRETGLMKVEFSYGAPKEKSGDILHLNDLGQLSVAGVLFQAILDKPVRIIAPGGSELLYNKP